MLLNNEIKAVLKLSLPMAMTQLITMGSGFLCMGMLAKLGMQVLAASALIFAINMTVLIACGSIFFSLSILLSRACGAQNYYAVGSFLQQGYLLAVILSIPVVIIFHNIAHILIYFKEDAAIANIVQQFFNAAIFNVLPFFLSMCNQQLCYGVQKQKIDMFANILGVFILLISANILIFGKVNLPKFGVVGFGYAIALQRWFYFIFTALTFIVFTDFKKFVLYKLHLQNTLHTLKNIFAIGWPISLQITSELLSFTITTAFVGWLGVTALSSYQIVLQYQFLIVIPIFAISQAAGILVSHALGSKTNKNIVAFGRASLNLTIIICLLAAIIFIFLPKFLTMMFINTHIAANGKIINLVKILFLFLSISQIFDALRNVLTGLLRGIFDMKYPMFISVFCVYIIGLPLSYLFAFIFKFGVVGISTGWIISLLISTLLLYCRWRKKFFCCAIGSSHNNI